MRITKRFLKPEVYLIFATFYYWFLTSIILNPVAIVILLVLFFQLIYKNIILGILLSTMLLFLNVFLFFALFMELKEFSEINNNFLFLLFFGIIYIVSNMIASVLLLLKCLNEMKTRMTL